MVLPRFLAELKHRKVYRAAVVYAAVGWALLEASDVVLPRLGLPDWTVNMVLAVVLLGFPLAIVFAWIFDISPQGIVRTEPLSPEGHPHRFSIAAIVEFVLILVLVVAVGGLYIDRLSLQQRLVEAESAIQGNPSADQQLIANPEQYRAIAVLPFADMSETGDQAWFAEGIAEELLHGLARVDELRIMARTSSFAFKDTDRTIAEIAEILNVQAVLEGSVRRFGDRVKVTAQLIDANSGFQIWSGSYEHQLSDIFKLQDEIARSIVKTLRVELGVANEGPLIAEQTESAEAYEWFLRGRALTTWANPEQIFQGISHFEKAVAIDPDYAVAWGWLSNAHGIALAFSPFEETSLSVIATYEKALALNPDQSEALVSKAMIMQISQYEHEEAGLLYQRAVASDDSAYAKNQYSFIYLISIDKTPLAIKYMLEAERLDPLHAGIKNNFTMVLRIAGESEAAALKAREALQLNPRHEIALANLIGAYAETGRFSAAEDVLRRMEPSLLERPRTRLHIGLYHAARGDLGKARDIYVDLRDNMPPYPFPYLASLALKLGEVEEAIDMMRIEIEKGSFTQFWIRPMFKNEPALKDHPRYLALLKLIGLDDESVAELHRNLSFD